MDGQLTTDNLMEHIPKTFNETRMPAAMLCIFGQSWNREVGL